MFMYFVRTLLSVLINGIVFLGVLFFWLWALSLFFPTLRKKLFQSVFPSLKRFVFTSFKCSAKTLGKALKIAFKWCIFTLEEGYFFLLTILKKLFQLLKNPEA